MSVCACMYTHKNSQVPFSRKPLRKEAKRDDDDFSRVRLEEWVVSAYGRNQCSPKDPALCAAHSLSSRYSVVRSQLIAAAALTSLQQQVCQSRLDSVSTTSYCVLKRLWDETQIVLHMSRDNLVHMTGQHLADLLEEVKSRRRRRYPGYSVQSLQQCCFVRWGSGDREGQEFIIPCHLIASTSTRSIWNGLVKSAACFTPTALNTIAANTRSVVVYNLPDGHPSNRLIMGKVAMEAENVVPIDGHCGSHLLQLCWETGAQDLIVNHTYAFTQFDKA